jgi:hypothetical protein
MKASTQQDLTLFFTETLDAIKKIKALVSGRNKTTKFKAIMSMLSLIEARLDSALKYCKAGGKSEFDVTMQQDMYIPIIQWLSEEITK